MNRYRKPIQRVLFALCLSLPLSALAAAIAPDQLVKTTSEQVLAVLSQTHDRQRLLQEAETKVAPHFDFKRMTQLAVGKSWRQATPEQQQALQGQFRNLLVRTYVNALAAAKQRHADVKMLPTADASSDGEVTVKTQVLPSGGQPLRIDYQMERSGNDWKVFDVLVENVSLVTNYRHSFEETIHTSGIDGLIQALTTKNRGLGEKT